MTICLSNFDMHFTAQAIQDSLTVLASLRPRSSNHENSPFIPPPAVLHAIHRTLPLSPSPGWYGNLPPGRTTVLRDDNTIKVKPGVPAVPASSTPAPTPAPAPSTPAVPATGYGSYSYAPYAGTSAVQQAQYRPGMYKPSVTSGASSYYQQPVYGQAYTASSGSGTQAYGGTWINPYTPQAAAAAVPTVNGSGSGSGGRGTPVALAPSYSSFFNNSGSLATAVINGTGTQPGRTPAVANTVVKPGQWNNPGLSSTSSPMTAHASQTLTLPLHLRQGQTQSQNGALPGQMGQLGQQSNFYGYQPGQYAPTPTSSMSAK